MTDDQKVRVDSGATGPGMMANNDAKDKNYAEYESGLEVVETGPEVVDDKHLPEVVDSYSRYAEYKQNSPLQVAHSQPASVVSSSIPGTQPGTQPGYFPPPQSASTLDDHKYNGGQNPFLSAGKKKDGTVCGLRKKMFWAVLAVLIIGVVVAIAVGLGVGLGIKTGSTASSTSSSTPAATSTASTGTFPAAVATATADSSTDIVCPYANRTVYTIETSSSSKNFLVLCGRDYNSAGGAFDISSMNITTFEGCLDECSQTQSCVGVGWGNYYNVDTCWLKSYVGTPNAAASWYAAVLVDSG